MPSRSSATPIPKRTYLKLIDKGDLDAIDPDIHRYAKNYKIRGSSGKLNIALDGLPEFAGLPQGVRATAPSISAATSTTSSAPSTISNTAPGPSGRSSIA